MSVFASIRKGFSFFLMSMGVSTYDKKPPAAKPVPTDVSKEKPE